MPSGRAKRRNEMPRYLVQRTFPEGLHIPVANGGAELCRGVVERNAEEGVTWISSFVSEDKTRTFCVYDVPTPEAIRKAAIGNELSVGELIEHWTFRDDEAGLVAIGKLRNSPTVA